MGERNPDASHLPIAGTGQVHRHMIDAVRRQQVTCENIAITVLTKPAVNLSRLQGVTYTRALITAVQTITVTTKAKRSIKRIDQAGGVCRMSV